MSDQFVRTNGVIRERRRTSFHNTLSMVIVLVFALICGATYWVVVGKVALESWATGMIGAVVGYWANSVTQIISYYYGASSPAQTQEQLGDQPKGA